MGCMVKALKMFDFGSWEEATSTAGKAPTTTKWIDRAREDDDGRLDRAARCGWSVRRLAVAVLCLPGDSLSLTRGWGSCSCLARACRSFIVSSMKRDASLARSPLNPARAVYIRLFPCRHADRSAPPDPRLSQATSCRTDSPGPGLPETQEPRLASCRPAGSAIDLPAPAPAASQSPFQLFLDPPVAAVRRCRPLCRFRGPHRLYRS